MAFLPSTSASSAVMKQIRVFARGFAAAPGNRSESSMNEMYMRALEPRAPPRPALSNEDRAKGTTLATTYTARMWRRHHVLSKDLNRKLKLKWAAIYALPTDELRKQALIVDPYIPLDYRLATETPPLMGFPGGGAATAAEEELENSTTTKTASSSASGTGTGTTPAETTTTTTTKTPPTQEEPAVGYIKGTIRTRRKAKETLDSFGMLGDMDLPPPTPAPKAAPPPPPVAAAAKAPVKKKK